MRGISPLTKDSNHALALAIALALGTFTNNAIVCRSTRQNASSRASVTLMMGERRLAAKLNARVGQVFGNVLGQRGSGRDEA